MKDALQQKKLQSVFAIWIRLDGIDRICFIRIASILHI